MDRLRELTGMKPKEILENNHIDNLNWLAYDKNKQEVMKNRQQ